jgi:LmbE family N-acetylglucosaminyl deacetylase
MNVLVVAPHPDDEAIGCGGAICLHVARGDRVVVAFLTSGELGLKHLSRDEAWRVREAEARSAGGILGVADMRFLRCPDWYLNENLADTAGLLQPVMDAEGPQVIYFPHPQESHPDHQATARILDMTLQRCQKQPVALYGYEVWSPLPAYDHIQDISKVMARKLRAVRCHRSQLAAIQYDRAVKGLNQYRGCLAGRCRYAEVFRRFEANDLKRFGEAAGPLVPDR